MKTIIFIGIITVINAIAIISIMVITMLIKRINQNLYNEIAKGSEDIVNAFIELFTGEKTVTDDSLMAYIKERNYNH